MVASVVVLVKSRRGFSQPALHEGKMSMRRIMVLLAASAMMAAMLAMPGVALAEADVCVSIKGHTKVDEGASSCFSSPDSRAVAVNSSDALALNNATAVAVNDSFALGVIDCTIVTTQPGELDACAF